MNKTNIKEIKKADFEGFEIDYIQPEIGMLYITIKAGNLIDRLTKKFQSKKDSSIKYFFEYKGLKYYLFYAESAVKEQRDLENDYVLLKFHTSK